MRWLYVWTLILSSFGVLAYAQEDQLGQDGFPQNYLPEDFLIPLMQSQDLPVSQPASSNSPSGKQPVTINVQSLPRVPSATALTGGASTLQQDRFVPLGAQTLAIPRVTGLEKIAVQPIENDVWAQSHIRHIQPLLVGLSQNTMQSITANKLLRRLLVTDTMPPKGSNSLSWKALRAQALLNMNMAEDAHAILQGVDVEALAADSELAKVWVLTMLMAGPVERACGFVKQQVLNADEPFWRQSLMVCQAVQGKGPALKLSLSLLDASVKGQDPGLFELLEAVAEDKEAFKSTFDITKLQTVVYATNPRLITGEVLPQLPDMMLRRIVDTEPLDYMLRLQAGELLVNRFGRTTDVLALGNLYDRLEFDVPTVHNPIQSALKEENGSRARALLWQASVLGNVASTRAQAFQAMWQRAQQDGLYNLNSALLPRQRNIQPHTHLAWFAPEVIPAALKGGDYKTAQEWWKVLEANKTVSGDVLARRADLTVAFAFMDKKVSQQTLLTWWESRQLNNPVEQAKLQRTLAVLDAMEVPVPLDIWQDLYATVGSQEKMLVGPGHVWLRLLSAELEAKRVGNALLMLLEPLAHTDAGTLSPQAIANIVTGLNYLGYTAEAQQLALEALLPASKRMMPQPAQNEMLDAAGTKLH